MVGGLDSDGPMHLIGQVFYIHVGHLIYLPPININALILRNRHHTQEFSSSEADNGAT
jgi:hypothetical protein